MSSIPSSLLYQAPPDAALKAQYVGQRLENIQAPAAIIDLATVKKNCKLMLEAADSLKVQFRAHVKTHKVCLIRIFPSKNVGKFVSQIPDH